MRHTFFQKIHKINRNTKEEACEIELDRSIFEKYYEGEIIVNPGDEYYFQIKAADSTIKALSNRDIQRLLRDVENSVLAVAMKGLSGEARKIIFSNLSVRVSVMIAEDMDSIGEIRVKDISSANSEILNNIIDLINAGEIKSFDSEMIIMFGKIIGASDFAN